MKTSSTRLSLSRNRLYDGLILSTVGLGPADTDLLKVDYPVVILGERIFDGPVDHVAMPNVNGACAATTHLIERGCRRIVMVDGQVSGEVDVSRLRLTGYRQALERSGIVFDPSLVVNIEKFTMQSGGEVARALVASRKRFDGVFCVTDTVAIGVLRGLADAGVRVPSRVKVIGFDNIDEGAFTVPSLSSIDPDHERMARTAVSLLVRRIEGRRGRKTTRENSSASSRSSSESQLMSEPEPKHSTVCHSNYPGVGRQARRRRELSAQGLCRCCIIVASWPGRTWWQRPSSHRQRFRKE